MKVTIGFINYGEAGGYTNKPYIPYFLNSLRAQTFQDFEVLCLDNASTDGSRADIAQGFPEVRIIDSSVNTGYPGHNLLMKEALGEYYWCVNMDMYYEPDALAHLVNALDTNSELGSVTPLLFRWDFKLLKPTTFIDTAGFDMYRSHYARERFVGKTAAVFESIDTSKPQPVFGVSGASGLFRRPALEDVRQGERGYFDETFFMYKEDVDLSYRIRWAGWQSAMVPLAVGYHDRTTGEKNTDTPLLLRLAQNREHKKQSNKYTSLRNQVLLLYKNFSWGYSLTTKLRTLSFETAKFFFILLREPSLLGAYTEAYRLIRSGKITKSYKKIPPREMEHYLS